MSAILQKAVDTVNRYSCMKQYGYINSYISMLAKLLFTASREQPSTSSRLSSPLTTSSATSSSMFCVPWSQYVHPSCSTFSSRSKLCSKISWCSSRCKTWNIVMFSNLLLPPGDPGDSFQCGGHSGNLSQHLSWLCGVRLWRDRCLLLICISSKGLKPWCQYCWLSTCRVLLVVFQAPVSASQTALSTSGW